MLDRVDALPLALERAGDAPWREAVAPSFQDRSDVPEFNTCEVARGSIPCTPSMHTGGTKLASMFAASVRRRSRFGFVRGVRIGPTPSRNVPRFTHSCATPMIALRSP